MARIRGSSSFIVVFGADPKVIRDQLLNIMLASRDTTACLLTFVTYFMALHPDVARKMREEVLQHCGRHGTPTLENIKLLRYGTCFHSSCCHCQAYHCIVISLVHLTYTFAVCCSYCYRRSYSRTCHLPIGSRPSGSGGRG